MTKVTIDENGHANISTLSDYVEVCDNSGRTVGYFYPADEQDDAVYANLVVPLSEEELERREKEVGGSSLAEIWQRLDPK